MAELILAGAEIFFFFFLMVYASYLFLSVTAGAWQLYQVNRMRSIKNELKHDFYFPVSILVPAHNEEVTILDSVESMLRLDYRLYEIVVVDDGSKDATSRVLIEHFHMQEISRPVCRTLPGMPIEAIYEAKDTRVPLTLVRKQNGGKGDALNVGINVSRYPWFICIDADSMLQRDSLERIVQPALEDDHVVAVGGLVRIAQCMKREGGALSYHLKWDLLTGMQMMEYDRSFLASRILLDSVNGNLIISGAFGLFRKDVVIAAGGYASDTLGEDMELVMKLHAFCRSQKRGYVIRYEPGAVCWSQAPTTWRDLMKQRRRWHLGLLQCLTRYRFMCLSPDYGLVGTLSYLYYFFFELFSPVIESAGLAVTVMAGVVGLLDVSFMVRFYLLFVLYGAILTMTAFFQRIYTQHLKVSGSDILRCCVMCITESLFFRFVLDFIRLSSMLTYRKQKNNWGEIRRVRQRQERQFSS